MAENKTLKDIKLSILDLVPILEGGTIAESFHNSLSLAQHAEAWGFHRYWVAEHHNMPGIASSATSVVIGYLAEGTSKIRVGSGGIMLPNHAPLMVAEQFGTLETLYPDRIDLGLGRAPGTDPVTIRALRREARSDGLDFPQMVAELRSYLEKPAEGSYRSVHAVPGEGLNIPIWLLGSSGFSAQLAGQLGLPFAFASHFSPDYTHPALNLYRTSFHPSNILEEPYVMVGMNVVAADTQEEADFLATSSQQQFLNITRNRPSRLQPPNKDFASQLTPQERASLQDRASRTTITGTPDVVKDGLQRFLDETEADEIIISSQIYDHQSRLRSYEIISEIVKA